MERAMGDETVDEVVDAKDRAYVKSLSPGPERDSVVASLLRYRTPEEQEIVSAVEESDDRRPAVPSRPAPRRWRPRLIRARPSR